MSGGPSSGLTASSSTLTVYREAALRAREWALVERSARQACEERLAEVRTATTVVLPPPVPPPAELSPVLWIAIGAAAALAALGAGVGIGVAVTGQGRP